jgi:hypothetical protein
LDQRYSDGGYFTNVDGSYGRRWQWEVKRMEAITKKNRKMMRNEKWKNEKKKWEMVEMEKWWNIFLLNVCSGKALLIKFNKLQGLKFTVTKCIDRWPLRKRK